MTSIKKYCRLLHIKHYLKNALIFCTVIFSGAITDIDVLLQAVCGFFAFSFAASFVYIINDICDRKRDAEHSIKCRRPIASGEISVKTAFVVASVMLLLSGGFTLLIKNGNIWLWLIPLIYIAANIAYSLGLKNYPIVDVVILSSGYLLRVFYGSAITGDPISNWLSITVMAFSLYMSLGKRRNELKNEGEHARKALEAYTYSFLDKNMYLCMALAIVFYSLWCIDAETIARMGSTMIVWTVPLVIIICLKYNITLEKSEYGDPVEIVFHDKVIWVLCLLYLSCVLLMIYL